MNTRSIVTALAFSLCLGPASGSARDDAVRKAISEFIATWNLPVDSAQEARLVPLGPRVIPGFGKVHRLRLAGHSFDVSSKGHVARFRAARAWQSTCAAANAGDEPALLVRHRLASIVQSWARPAETVRGGSWLPELESDQGRVMVVLKERAGLKDGRVTFRNYVHAVFDADRCLLALDVSDATVTRSASAAISEEKALANANAWLAKHGSWKAVDASLEIKFVAAEPRLVWVPATVLDGDLAVAAPLWVDARTGRISQASAEPESLRLESFPVGR